MSAERRKPAPILCLLISLLHSPAWGWLQLGDGGHRESLIKIIFFQKTRFIFRGFCPIEMAPDVIVSSHSYQKVSQMMVSECCPVFSERSLQEPLAIVPWERGSRRPVSLMLHLTGTVTPGQVAEGHVQTLIQAWVTPQWSNRSKNVGGRLSQEKHTALKDRNFS